MKKIIIFFLLAFINTGFCQEHTDTSDTITTKYITGMQQLVIMHEQIKSLYPALEKLYPIALA